MLSLKGSTCGLLFVTVFWWIYLTTDFVCLLGGPVCSGKALHSGRLVVTSQVYRTVASGDLANLYLFNNGMTLITVQSITTWHMSQVIWTHHTSSLCSEALLFPPFTKPRTRWVVCRCSKVPLSSCMKSRKYIRFQRKWTKYCSLIQLFDQLVTLSQSIIQ